MVCVEGGTVHLRAFVVSCVMVFVAGCREEERNNAPEDGGAGNGSSGCAGLAAIPDLDEVPLTPRVDVQAEVLALGCSVGLVADTSVYQRIHDDLAAIYAVDPHMGAIRDWTATPGSHAYLQAFTPEDAQRLVAGGDPAFQCVTERLGGMTASQAYDLVVGVEFRGVFDATVLAAAYAGVSTSLYVPRAALGDGPHNHADPTGNVRVYLFDEASGDCPAGCAHADMFLWHVTGTADAEMVDQWHAAMGDPRPPWADLAGVAACNKCDGRVVHRDTPEDCDDGADNDCDGDLDCADSQCRLATMCQPEICDNHQDDNGNGDTDCDDTGCTYAVACGGRTCGSPSDQEALARHSMGIRWWVTRNSLACSQQPPPVSACVAENLRLNGFSLGCAACLGQLGQCSTESCSAECRDPGGADCITCQEAGCAPSLYTCLGESVPDWFSR